MITSFNLKVLALFFFLFTSVLKLYSQQPQVGAFNFQSELQRMVHAPNSPEAQAFEQYGTQNVSLYTGTPNISVPIYSIEGREFSLPINLSYDASGIKVSQLATNVGLGWNLNVGGMVSRIINGNVDDYIQSGSSPHATLFNPEVREEMITYIDNRIEFEEREDVEEYYNFLHDINRNKTDTQPDYFSINVPGLSDMITWDYNLNEVNAIALDDPKLKISYTSTTQNNPTGKNVTGWVVKGADGMTYEFKEAETTYYQGNDASSSFNNFKTYNSSWVLTKLISPNGKDTYIFQYQDASFNDFQPMNVSGSTTYNIDQNTPLDNAPPNNTSSFQPSYKIDSKVLKKIFHNGNEIININHSTRYDVSASDAVSSIDIKDQHGVLIKKFELEHSYFGIPSGANPTSYDSKNIRLKLDEVKFTTSDGADEYKTYKFDYFTPEDVPSIISNSQDYLGYYNGRSNGNLLPTTVLGDYTFQGADRSPNIIKAITGTLSKITYPTGGNSKFTYEPHTTPPDNSDFIENTQDVTYGYLALQGNVVNAQCNDAEALCQCWDGWCMDLWQAAMPEVEQVTFTIPEDGLYTLKYEVNRTSSDGSTEGFKTMATVFKRNSSSSGCSTVPFGDVIDLDYTGNWLIPESRRVFHSDLDKQALGLDDEMGVFLTEGCYQISIVNPNPSEHIYLQVYREETTITELTTPIERAGFRIKNIKTYTEGTNLAFQKSYKYTNTLTGTTTTGKKLFDPHFYLISNGRKPGEEGGQCAMVDYTSLTIYSSSSGGSRPHVAYSTVLEIDGVPENESNNGYVSHSFATRINSGLFSTGVPPNVNSYHKDVDAGKEWRTAVRSNTGAIISQNRNVYSSESQTHDYFYNYGIYLRPNPMKSYSDLVTRPYGNGYTYDFAEWIYGSTSTNNGDGSVICAWFNPLVCDSNNSGDPNWQCQLLSYAPDFEFTLTSAGGKIGGVVQEVKQEYLGQLLPNQTVTNYEYDSSIGYLLRESQTIFENNDEIITEYQYPEDLDSQSPYSNMVADNQLTQPITTTTIAGNAYSKKEVEFIQMGSKFLPNTVNIGKGMIDSNGVISNIENSDRVYYTYYSNGNIKTSYQLDGSTSSSIPTPLNPKNSTGYIWGYDSKYPIVIIKNAKYGDFSSFVSNIQSKSNADLDRTQGYNGTEGDLRQAIDNLRNAAALSNALVTSYTYDPGIGVTSQTDPRGNTIYYVYDNQHRLEFVKDKDGNILSKNEYNYKVNN